MLLTPKTKPTQLKDTPEMISHDGMDTKDGDEENPQPRSNSLNDPKNDAINLSTSLSALDRNSMFTSLKDKRSARN